ncbi:hypothetical protein ACFLTS_01800 [Chloroflexota bacterium]
MFLKEHSAKTKPFILEKEERQATYLTRIDPLSGNVSKISEERAKRNIAVSIALNVQPVEHCDFCNYSENTPEGRIEHECGAVSVPNKYPWEKHDWVTIYPPFGTHKLLISDLCFDDMERLIESSYDLALECSKDPEVIAFMDFTNWGIFAGASQQHPHSQRKSVTYDLDPKQKLELRLCNSLWEQHNKNPFDMLRDEERAQGRRVIYDNDIFIAAAFAPSCPDEVIAFPNEDFSHILQMSSSDRRRTIRPLLGVFPSLFFYRGITDLNIAIHMAPFNQMEAARKYYRWHIHIYPRRSRFPVDKAGAEIGFETNVIDSLPETTAEALRRWYQEGPKGERIAKSTDEGTDLKLLQEFHKFSQIHAVA